MGQGPLRLVDYVKQALEKTNVAVVPRQNATSVTYDNKIVVIPDNNYLYSAKFIDYNDRTKYLRRYGVFYPTLTDNMIKIAANLKNIEAAELKQELNSHAPELITNACINEYNRQTANFTKQADDAEQINILRERLLRNLEGLYAEFTKPPYDVTIIDHVKANINEELRDQGLNLWLFDKMIDKLFDDKDTLISAIQSPPKSASDPNYEKWFDEIYDNPWSQYSAPVLSFLKTLNNSASKFPSIGLDLPNIKIDIPVVSQPKPNTKGYEKAVREAIQSTYDQIKTMKNKTGGNNGDGYDILAIILIAVLVIVLIVIVVDQSDSMFLAGLASFVIAFVSVSAARSFM